MCDTTLDGGEDCDGGEDDNGEGGGGRSGGGVEACTSMLCFSISSCTSSDSSYDVYSFCVQSPATNN
jgi:hypothetical protein